jgi:hypothetical protein
MRSLMAFAAVTLLTATLASAPAFAAGHDKVMLNPQLEPPGRFLPPGPCRSCKLALTQPRVGPGDPVERVMLNPQPLPPRRMPLASGRAARQ